MGISKELWYFWDETQAGYCGPYTSEMAARFALDQYCEHLNPTKPKTNPCVWCDTEACICGKPPDPMLECTQQLVAAILTAADAIYASHSHKSNTVENYHWHLKELQNASNSN